MAATLLALSLAHLSSGILAITHCHPVEAFALAIGIDLGLVAAEAALLVANAAASRTIKKWCNGVIAGTLLWSGALNATVFAAHAEGIWWFAAIAFGLAIPAMVFALTKISVGLAKTR